MATKQQGSSRPTERQHSSSLSNFSRNLKDSWIGRNWQTVLLLVMMVFLALFVRSYFGYSTSVENGYLVSGGSDSYYHMRVIDHAVATGDHLVWDDMLNYPNGMRNPRPPLYDWSVAVVGMLLSTITGLAVNDAVGLTLVFSTAVWGALTVVPVFLLGNAAFGRKAGILGAFIFALMAGHVERTVLSNADHDAMVLFFVVFSFYFLLRSLQSVNGSRWVADWRRPKTILPGIKGYLGTNQLSLLYAALGGICVAAVGLIWTGYTYLLIIVFVYFIVQLLVDRFRNADSMGVLFPIAVFFGLAFLVMAPMYVSLNLVDTWLDTPIFLYLVGMVGGLMFVVTRDYPWTLVLPVFTVIIVAVLALLSLFAPGLFESIVTGQGYLVKSKLYSTISEAQAPGFSSLAMSFGMVTFWLSLIGIGWAAYKVPKNINPHFIFVVVWVGISVYMAASAARFVFNASPAFAVSAGWMLGLIIDRLKFDEMVKGLSTDHGGLWKTIRSSVKLRHVVGVIFIALMILVPNVWYALDAGIPSTTKRDYDRQIYLAMPDFLRPGDYDVENGTSWYLGAFNYGMSLPNEYWPVAWKWLSSQNTDRVSPLDRPAFLSWWDYGFEAIQQGGHPAVADNFQNGYQFAGSFLMTQTEEGAIALLIVRCMESAHTYDAEALYSLMASYGVDTVRLKDIMSNPANYIDEVRNNPDLYGPYDQELSAGNAKYAAAREVLSRLDKGQLASLYNEVRGMTGNDIGYVAIDSRLFPFTATSFNIFYAPAKLSDQRVDGNNIPYDYYQIYAVDYYGERIPLDQVTADDLIVDYEIVYTEAFYDTMLYRTFMGYGPSDVGESKQGLPGISGSLQSYPSMQGWNMTNFRMVYRTAYYNPFPSDQVANHTDAWRAISYAEGVEMYNLIQSGALIGTVDLSSSGLYSGVVFLQYYDGAIIEGTAVSDTGRPMSNIWVTVLDELGIPHQVVRTDDEGRYSVLAPFGETTLVFSYGDLDPRMLYGTELYSTTLDITYDQAMRVNADLDKDGQLDYLIDLDVVVEVAALSGQVFIDNDGDGEYSSSMDEKLVGAKVIFENATNGFRAEGISTLTGYEIPGIPPMKGEVWAEYQGHAFGRTSVEAKVSTTEPTDLSVEPANLTGTATLADGSPANGVTISLLDQSNGSVIESITDSFGEYSFQGLLPGNYTIITPDGTVVQGADISLDEAEALQRDLVLYESMRVTGLVSYNGQAVSNAMVGLTGDLGQTWVRSDSRGRYSAVVPKGDISLYATATVGGQEAVFLSKVTATSSANIDLQLQDGRVLEGSITSSGSAASGATVRMQDKSSGAVFTAVSNSEGWFRAVLPSGLYSAYMSDGTRAYWSDLLVSSSISSDFVLLAGVKVSGKVWYDANGDGAASSNESVMGATVTVTGQDGRAIVYSTGSTGAYSMVLPSGRSYTLTVTKNGFEDSARSYPSLDSQVTEDVEMVAQLRAVTGTISSGATGITVRFEAVGGPAANASAVTGVGGIFAVQLYPGQYQVYVDQDQTPGDSSIRVQSLAPMDLTVAVGRDPSALEVQVVDRMLVSGAISPGGSATLVFDGPERTTVAASGSYSVYLQPGSYSLYVRVDNGSLRSADLSRVNVSAPSTVNLAANTAIQALIRAEMAGAKTGDVEISIERDGAYYNVTTQSTGLATVYLAPGDYTASVDHATTVVIKDVTRFVRYTGQANFTLSGVLRNIQIDTEQALDNATVHGDLTYSATPASAVLQFQAASESAMDLSVEATGSYSVQLAPGRYDVYAVNGDSQAFMGTLDVDAPGDVVYDIALREAFRLSGVTFADGSPVSAEITVTGMGELKTSSGLDGHYEVYLPSGDYLLAASAILAESGLAVTYSGEAQVALSGVISKGIEMDKVVSRSVKLNWDTLQKVTLSAGETATYTIRITNGGNVPDTYRLTASGTGWTVVLSQTEVTIGYGATNSQIVTVQITPSSTVNVKHTPVTVRAVSVSNSSVSGSVSLDANISPFLSVSASYAGAKVTDGTSYVHTVKLTNNGNVDDTYTVTIGNRLALRELGWEVRLVSGTDLLDELSVTVTAGKSSDVQISMVPIRQNPSPTASVQLVAVSHTDDAVQEVLEVRPDLVGLSVGSLVISGSGVSDSPPRVGNDTIVLLGVAMALMAMFLVLSIQKGVFSRRKR